MAVFSKLRGRLRRRKASDNPGMDLKSGAVGPRDYGIDVAEGRHADFEEDTPWHDLKGFIGFLIRQRGRIRLRLSKKQPQSTTWVTEPPLSPIILSTISTGSRNKNHNDQDEGLGAAQTGANEDNDVQGAPHGSSQPRTELRSMDARNDRKITSSASVAQMTNTEGTEYTAIGSRHEPGSSSNMTARAAVGVVTDTESNMPDISRTDSPTSSYHSLPDENEGAPPVSYIPPPIPDGTPPWAQSVASIDMGKAESSAASILYDTATPCNWISKQFMADFRVEPRPIRPEDMAVFETVEASYIPREYAEVTLKDDSHGIKWTKVRCMVQANMNGCGLVLGSGFMKTHRVILRPYSGYGAYVTTASRAPASAGKVSKSTLTEISLTKPLAAKREQQKLDDQANRGHEEYERLLQSSARTTTMEAGTSRGGQAEASSRTSTTTYHQPEEPKEPEDPKEAEEE
ncbi:hypothetical protein BKA61DRAFT_576598 [Leptodontidium sp. MPI-SDFR-AT-0119]|nr:hypothetical protein BKA61DRAFT_576598 [Leptodontidium sp. MPI-SDFR-AT-0119]